MNGRNEASLTEALERQAGPGQVGPWTPWLYNRYCSSLLTPCFPTMLLRLIPASLASVSRQHPSHPSFGHERDEALISKAPSPRHWPCPPFPSPPAFSVLVMSLPFSELLKITTAFLAENAEWNGGGEKKSPLDESHIWAGATNNSGR